MVRADVKELWDLDLQVHRIRNRSIGGSHRLTISGRHVKKKGDNISNIYLICDMILYDMKLYNDIYNVI